MLYPLSRLQTQKTEIRGQRSEAKKTGSAEKPDCLSSAFCYLSSAYTVASASAPLAGEGRSAFFSSSSRA